MREAFRASPDFRHTYVANVAMLLHDNYEITDCKTRNKAADEIIALVFGENEDEDPSDQDSIVPAGSDICDSNDVSSVERSRTGETGTVEDVEDEMGRVAVEPAEIEKVIKRLQNELILFEDASPLSLSADLQALLAAFSKVREERDEACPLIEIAIIGDDGLDGAKGERYLRKVGYWPATPTDDATGQISKEESGTDDGERATGLRMPLRTRWTLTKKRYG